MFKRDSKYKLIFLILKAFIFTYLSVNGFYAFANNHSDKGMKMIGGIIFGIAAIFFSVEVYNFLKNNKSIKSGA